MHEPRGCAKLYIYLENQCIPFTFKELTLFRSMEYGKIHFLQRIADKKMSFSALPQPRLGGAGVPSCLDSRSHPGSRLYLGFSNTRK